jgi:hypothetical protein
MTSTTRAAARGVVVAIGSGGPVATRTPLCAPRGVFPGPDRDPALESAQRPRAAGERRSPQAITRGNVGLDKKWGGAAPTARPRHQEDGSCCETDRSRTRRLTAARHRRRLHHRKETR